MYQWNGLLNIWSFGWKRLHLLTFSLISFVNARVSTPWMPGTSYKTFIISLVVITVLGNHPLVTQSNWPFCSKTISHNKAIKPYHSNPEQTKHPLEKLLLLQNICLPAPFLVEEFSRWKIHFTLQWINGFGEKYFAVEILWNTYFEYGEKYFAIKQHFQILSQMINLFSLALSERNQWEFRPHFHHYCFMRIEHKRRGNSRPKTTYVHIISTEGALRRPVKI